MMANLKNAVSASEFRYCMSLDNAWMGFGFDRNLGPDSMLSGAKTLDRAGCPFSIVGAWECGTLSVSGPACYGWCIGWELHGTTVSGRWKGDQTSQPHPSIRQWQEVTACDGPLRKGRHWCYRWAMVGHDGPTSFDFVSLRQLVRCRSESTGLLPASRSGAPTADGSCSVGRAARNSIGDTWGWHPCSSLYASTMAKAE